MTSKAITTFNQLHVHCPFFEWPRKETCWYVWWPHGAPVAPPAPVTGCGQRKRCQHIGLWASLIWYYPFFSCFWYTDQCCCSPLAPVLVYSYCLPNSCYFCKLHCSLSCVVLLCALVKYLVNRTAYDESTLLIVVLYSTLLETSGIVW